MTASADRVRSLLRRPVVVAPMAGGPSTPELVAAASEAGALGFLAAGYKSAEAMLQEMAVLREATSHPYGVNLFVPGRRADRTEHVERYVESLAAEATVLGVELGQPRWDDDHWSAKLDALLSDPPPVVSFTFGCPSSEIVAAFRSAGAAVVVTVTTPGEARVAAAAGADCLSLQGPEAGAHRGTFANEGTPARGPDLHQLVELVADITDLPLFAAGGLMTADAVAAVLRAGALGAQCGTAFLRCPESGADPRHKDALADPRFTRTTVTRSFSGRPARGLDNRFMREHPDAPAAYPEINNATRPLRTAASAAHDVDRMSLWAGEGFKQALEQSAGEVVERLASLS